VFLVLVGLRVYAYFIKFVFMYVCMCIKFIIFCDHVIDPQLMYGLLKMQSSIFRVLFLLRL
jgi:hypothetical protein